MSTEESKTTRKRKSLPRYIIGGVEGNSLAGVVDGMIEMADKTPAGPDGLAEVCTATLKKLGKYPDPPAPPKIPVEVDAAIKAILGQVVGPTPHPMPQKRLREIKRILEGVL